MKLQDLSGDIFYEILKHSVTDIDTYMKNIYVCKQWLNLCLENRTRCLITDYIFLAYTGDMDDIRQKICRWSTMFPNIKSHTDISLYCVDQGITVGIPNHIESYNTTDNTNKLIPAHTYDITDLSFLHGIRNLTMINFANVVDLSPLKGISFLNISGCRQITDLTPLKGIYALDIGWCRDITDITPLKGIHTLNIFQCTGIESLEPLKGIRELCMQGCEQITDLYSIASSLHTLDITFCSQFTDLSSLAYASSLSKLILRYCHITDLSPLMDLPLQHLDINNCHNITDLSPISNCPIRYLDMSRCLQITDISPLKGMTTLVDLIISDCCYLTDITPLKNANINLTMYYCDQIIDIETLSSIRTVIGRKIINTDNCVIQ